MARRQTHDQRLAFIKIDNEPRFGSSIDRVDDASHDGVALIASERNLFRADHDGGFLAGALGA
jgi:hypothetical protein